MGLNESAGYVAVGLVAFATGWIATEYGIHPYPFYLGIGFASAGLLLSWLFVRDTVEHVSVEAVQSSLPLLRNLFWQTSLTHRNLGSITQAGLVNNLNDAMIWGLLPIILLIKGFDLEDIGKIVALYPMVWGIGQLFTGKLADTLNKKQMLFWGMLLQGIVLLMMISAQSFLQFATLSILLGVGTAVVYPTFLAAIADHSHPEQRARAIGTFRFWRDLGYAVGALLTGILADLADENIALACIGFITVLSAVVIQLRMKS